jgi:hypothetical protein
MRAIKATKRWIERMARLILRSAPAPGGGSSNWRDAVGLLWADGVETAGNEATVYPVGGSNRVWYVNANAVSNGDGSSGSPFNSFTELNDPLSLSGYAAGDHIYITGDFTQTKHAAGTNDMGLVWNDPDFFGTTSNPTVIRSWPGQSRAKIDGEYFGVGVGGGSSIGLLFNPTTGAITKGVVVYNVELTRCVPNAISFGAGGDYHVGLQRVVSCWVHHNFAEGAGGPVGASRMGGISLMATQGAASILIEHNVLHNNNGDGVDTYENNNNAAIDILSDVPGDGTLLTARYNVIHDEYRAFGNKWAGPIDVDLYYNEIYDSTTAFFVRASGLQEIHHNLVYGTTTFIHADAENQTTQGGQLRTIQEYNNTVVGATTYFYFSDAASYSDLFSSTDTIFSNSAITGSFIFAGPFGSSAYNIGGMSFDGSILHVTSTTNFYTDDGTTKSRTDFTTQFGASTTFDDPQLDASYIPANPAHTSKGAFA